MISSLLSLSFVNPWILAALFGLPLLYWLIKISPPTPKTVAFSAVYFLLRLKQKEETTTSIPWWLLVLRMCIAALIIIALAEPRLNPSTTVKGDGPAVIFIDNSWAAAPSWNEFETRLKNLLMDMKEQQRMVYLLPLSANPNNKQLKLQAVRPELAMDQMLAFKPTSVPMQRLQIQDLLDQFRQMEKVSFYWLSDALVSSDLAHKTQNVFYSLGEIGPLTIYSDTNRDFPFTIGSPDFDGKNTVIPVVRVEGSTNGTGTLIARGRGGKILAQNNFEFENKQLQATVTITLPTQVRNDVTSLEIVDSNSAASRYLMDHRHQRRKLGLISDQQSTPVQAFLRENHYLEKALLPFFDLQKAPLADLLKSDNSLIVMGDVGSYSKKQTKEIKQWINKGGVLVRFAGPKLANSQTTLTPVRLRSGSRNLDGSISWSKPAPIGKMPKNSPFSTLSVPADITIKKQVLAVPSIELGRKTWAQLADGTPLVTADQWGEGTIILFHTTATTKWSNLPLSGLFVEMLREIGQLANNNIALFSTKSAFPPLAIMDGYGGLSDDTSTVADLNLSGTQTPRIGPENPAGHYGTPMFKIALNVGDGEISYDVLDLQKMNASVFPMDMISEKEMQPYILALVFCLILLDLLMVLSIQGDLRSLGRTSGIFTFTVLVPLSLFLGISLNSNLATAEEDLQRLLDATLDTRLAYVLTGNSSIDKISRSGLQGLSTVITRRTSVETASPLPVNIETNELVFFPFVYWPITPDFPVVSDMAVNNINKYLSVGGIILFDTRNQHASGRYGGIIANSPENKRLQQLLARIHIPRLMPVPVDHVLTRSFYLMQAFPGRYETGDLWISDASDISGNDGVSSVLIGSNDWAAAWATNKNGRPMASVIPGSERQRELARRFGINLVMYSLTGSYKADQVHIPAILNRLSQ
ncbi:hypothetical protein A9Q83_09940 [Alphaproteobacteria bacterium 46_93_T64]|nr:hypothetical protein A9Q83_09940 [Alphaproteobacteria bacterium 46_93_T64]